MFSIRALWTRNSRSRWRVTGTSVLYSSQGIDLWRRSLVTHSEERGGIHALKQADDESFPPPHSSDALWSDT